MPLKFPLGTNPAATDLLTVDLKLVVDAKPKPPGKLCMLPTASASVGGGRPGGAGVNAKRGRRGRFRLLHLPYEEFSVPEDDSTTSSSEHALVHDVYESSGALLLLPERATAGALVLLPAPPAAGALPAPPTAGAFLAEL